MKAKVTRIKDSFKIQYYDDKGMYMKEEDEYISASSNDLYDKLVNNALSHGCKDITIKLK